MSCFPDHKPPALSPAQKAWAFFRQLARPALARKLGTLVTEGYLAETGWVRSMAIGQIVDGQGEPLPWLTYPFIEFLTPRLQPHWTVWEFGAGASTLYYARHVRAVISVEHDESFATALRPRLPVNVRLHLYAAGTPDYSSALAASDRMPDVVIVDGVDREECLRQASECLAPRAVIVLDDAERAEYAGAVLQLKEKGFRAVEFWGLAPGLVHGKCTTVFYRPDNVLGL